MEVAVLAVLLADFCEDLLGFSEVLELEEPEEVFLAFLAFWHCKHCF